MAEVSVCMKTKAGLHKRGGSIIVFHSKNFSEVFLNLALLMSKAVYAPWRLFLGCCVTRTGILKLYYFTVFACVLALSTILTKTTWQTACSVKSTINAVSVLTSYHTFQSSNFPMNAIIFYFHVSTSWPEKVGHRPIIPESTVHCQVSARYTMNHCEGPPLDSQARASFHAKKRKKCYSCASV